MSGLSYSAAIAAVQRENRPVCLCCGSELLRGFFCTDKIQCRKAFRRYKWKRQNGIPKETALREAVCH
jgi:hypothetical protein